MNHVRKRHDLHLLIKLYMICSLPFQSNVFSIYKFNESHYISFNKRIFISKIDFVIRHYRYLFKLDEIFEG